MLQAPSGETLVSDLKSAVNIAEHSNSTTILANGLAAILTTWKARLEEDGRRRRGRELRAFTYTHAAYRALIITEGQTIPARERMDVALGHLSKAVELLEEKVFTNA